ncbi:hypothetical protein [Streptomyces sp. NBC_00582]|uniref:hypothetical protein n=1 Tax=Streptomyces sp. NBC_00582 TaxID=2975783 RepID=UPI002E814976|nr:hypothetical protein [Streptomyces sp. NBC_00582]WUB68285.1 hypothetical protein OG852_46665 [Streptomyces sp. NBC_00582]
MSEWHVVWVPGPGRWGTPPTEAVLGIRDLPEAVARMGLLPGDPVYIRPDGMVDRDFLDFVRSAVFRNLERDTKRNYGTDYRPLLSFLSSLGSYREMSTGSGCTFPHLNSLVNAAASRSHFVPLIRPGFSVALHRQCR